MSLPTVLVTNALAFAGPPAIDAFDQEHFNVVAHDPSFSDPDMRERYHQAHPSVHVLSEQAPSAIVEAGWQLNRRLDVLVSNDVHPPIHSQIAEANIGDLEATLARLVTFPFGVVQAAVPKLKQQKTARVVMVTSNRTRLPFPGGAIPDIARAGLNALVKSLSLELAPFGIPVNAVAPNYLYSEAYYPKAQFEESAKGRAFIEQTVPVGRLGQPEEVGELIRYLATMKGSFMTGAIIDFSGGWPSGPVRPG